MATRNLSKDAKRYSSYVYGNVIWSDWVDPTGTDVVWGSFHAYVFHRVNLYKGSDVQSLNSISISVPVNAPSGADNVKIQAAIFTRDVTGGNDWPSGGRAGAQQSIYYLHGSTTYTCEISLSGITADTIYIGYWVDYGNGSASVDSGSTTVTENYTAKVLPNIALGKTINTDTGVTIPIVNGSNYTLTCKITARSNDYVLYNQTSSTGQFDVPITPATWFNQANVTNSLSIPITIDVYGDSPNSIHEATGSYTVRQSDIDSLRPVVASVTPEIQQAPGAATTYYPRTYIAGYSKCKVTAVITRPTYAEITSVYLSYPGGSPVEMVEEDPTNEPGTYSGTTWTALAKDTEFTVTATDQRTLQGTKKAQVTGVVPYVLPSVNVDLAFRCDELGDETDGGDYYRITVTPQISNRLTNPANEVTVLTVGLKVNGAARHNLLDPNDTQPYRLLPAGEDPDPSSAYIISIIIQDKISGQVTRDYILKGKQRDLVLNHDGGRTHIGIGASPTGKGTLEYKGKDTVELPADGLLLIGGFPAQAFHYPYIRQQLDEEDHAEETYDAAWLNRNFLNYSADRTGIMNATTIFSLSAADCALWDGIPADPLDTLSPASGINTYGWAGWREVYYVDQDRVLVKVMEIAPSPGRIWFCARVRSATEGEFVWTSWRYLKPTSV